MAGLMYHFYDSNTVARPFPLTSSGFAFHMNNPDLVLLTIFLFCLSEFWLQTAFHCLEATSTLRQLYFYGYAF